MGNHVILAGLYVLGLLMGCSQMSVAETWPDPVEIPLWDDEPPGAIHDADTTEVVADRRYANIHEPTITFYAPSPDRANGISVLVFPGGGYHHLAMGHEGHDVAVRLRQAGFIACVVKYRVAPYRRPVPQRDAAQAMKLAREKVEERGGDPNRIGVLGFSAGGHLAGSLCVLPGKSGVFPDGKVMPESARPGFAVLIYPVISMSDEVGESGSRGNLLGHPPDKQDIELYSLDQQVDAKTPTMFLVHAEDDHVSIANSKRMFKALQDAGIPAEFMRLETGGHGFGLGQDQPATAPWPNRAIAWINKLYEHPSDTLKE